MIKLVTFQVKSSSIHHLEEQTFKLVALNLGSQIQRECFHYREAVKWDLDKDKSIYWIIKRIKLSCYAQRYFSCCVDLLVCFTELQEIKSLLKKHKYNSVQTANWVIFD